MSIEVTPELVEEIAKLARIKLSASELEELHGHFDKVLRFVESLDALDTSEVDPSIFPRETANVVQEDVVKESLPVDEALANAPSGGDGFFLVPRIIQES